MKFWDLFPGLIQSKQVFLSHVTKLQNNIGETIQEKMWQSASLIGNLLLALIASTNKKFDQILASRINL